MAAHAEFMRLWGNCMLICCAFNSPAGGFRTRNGWRMSKRRRRGGRHHQSQVREDVTVTIVLPLAEGCQDA